MSQPGFPRIILPVRSMGVKLIVVCFLALVMSIPALFVWALIEDRSERAQQVVTEVSNLVGGPQTFLGPVLAVPYTALESDNKTVKKGTYVVFPTHGEAAATTQAEVRHRSLFKVPVYHSDIAFRASFDVPAVLSNVPAGAELDWSRAEFVVATSDPRGARSDITLTAGGKTFTLGPAPVMPPTSITLENGGEVQLTFFGTPAKALAQLGSKFEVAAEMKFSGAQRLSFLAFAGTTVVTMKGDWPIPASTGFAAGDAKRHPLRL